MWATPAAPTRWMNCKTIFTTVYVQSAVIYAHSTTRFILVVRLSIKQTERNECSVPTSTKRTEHGRNLIHIGGLMHILVQANIVSAMFADICIDFEGP
jgi:hypothetical protein